jgi:hypothetical protein
MTDDKQTKNLIIYILGLGLIIFFFFFVLSTSIIGYSVKAKCQIAQAKYPGDCVEALISYLEDKNNDFRSRNSAIWALGQLGDSRSLPVLKKYYISYNGERCNRHQELAS